MIDNKDTLKRGTRVEIVNHEINKNNKRVFAIVSDQFDIEGPDGYLVLSLEDGNLIFINKKNLKIVTDTWDYVPAIGDRVMVTSPSMHSFGEVGKVEQLYFYPWSNNSTTICRVNIEDSFEDEYTFVPASCILPLKESRLIDILKSVGIKPYALFIVEGYDRLFYLNDSGKLIDFGTMKENTDEVIEKLIRSKQGRNVIKLQGENCDVLQLFTPSVADLYPE